jgi:hypothetical protein
VPFGVTVTDFNGHPVNNAAVRYATAGANPTSGVVNTNATGQATINLSGANPGDDGLLAYADLNGNSTHDAGEPLAAAKVHWNAFSVPTTKGAQGGNIDITAVAPEAGTFTATATYVKNGGKIVAAANPVVYGTASATATHAGPVSFIVKPNKAGKRALRKKGHFSVTVHLSFRSSAHLGSSTATKDFKIKVHKRKH